jgi:hypothetical protein
MGAYVPLGQSSLVALIFWLTEIATVPMRSLYRNYFVQGKPCWFETNFQSPRNPKANSMPVKTEGHVCSFAKSFFGLS